MRGRSAPRQFQPKPRGYSRRRIVLREPLGLKAEFSRMNAGGGSHHLAAAGCSVDVSEAFDCSRHTTLPAHSAPWAQDDCLLNIRCYGKTNVL